MKKCPICGAVSFNDMNVCYSCMHNFKEDESCGIISIHTPLDEQRESLNICASYEDLQNSVQPCGGVFPQELERNQSYEEIYSAPIAFSAKSNDGQNALSISSIEKNNKGITLGVFIPWGYLQQKSSVD